MPPRNDWDNHIATRKTNLPVYALVSTENLLLTEAVQELRMASPTVAADFNRDEFRASETPINVVLDAAQTLPMMASLRWVHLSDIHKLKAKEHGPLLSYLNNPCPSTTLCLSGTKIDLRTKLGQSLSKSGTLFNIAPPRRGAIIAWTQKRAQKQGFKLQIDAAHLLVDLIGHDIGSLNMAIFKAGIYANGEPIETEHIEASVAATRVHTIFELTDAIGARNLSQAFDLLRNIMDGGDSGLRVLGMIVRQLRQLLFFKEVANDGATNAAIAKNIGVPAFQIDKLKRQAQFYQVNELHKNLQLASQIDLQLKSSRFRHDIILNKFILQMMEPT